MNVPRLAHPKDVLELVCKAARETVKTDRSNIEPEATLSEISGEVDETRRMLNVQIFVRRISIESGVGFTTTRLAEILGASFDRSEDRYDVVLDLPLGLIARFIADQRADLEDLEDSFLCRLG